MIYLLMLTFYSICNLENKYNENQFLFSGKLISSPFDNFLRIECLTFKVKSSYITFIGVG